MNRCPPPLAAFWRPGFMRREEGAVAVEMAILLPLFLMMIFGVIVVAYVAAVSSSLQQLAADAGRASVGGLDAGERQALAEAALTAGLVAHPLLDPVRITRAVVQQTTPLPAIRVTLTYDLSGTPVTALNGLVDLGLAQVRREAFLAY